MTSNLFFYKRQEKTKVKLEYAEGQTGPSEREEIIDYWDCLNVDTIVRGMAQKDGSLILLLNDGHEQSQDQRVPILAKDGHTPKGYEIKRVRDWYYSQVILVKEDAERFRAIYEAL